jgi:hypothetical protein
MGGKCDAGRVGDVATAIALCVPIPGTDYELCNKPLGAIGIAVAVSLVIGVIWQTAMRAAETPRYPDDISGERLCPATSESLMEQDALGYTHCKTCGRPLGEHASFDP